MRRLLPPLLTLAALGLAAAPPVAPPGFTARARGKDAAAIRKAWADRVRTMGTDEALGWMKVAPGMRIGEAGAGSGFLTFQLARAVGPTGRVYAGDIDRGSLEELLHLGQAWNEGANIVPVLGEVRDPRFPETGLDMLALCNAFHDFTDRKAWLANARRYLKPGGTLAVIDFYRKGHGDLTSALMRSLAQEAGFRFVLERPMRDHETLYLFTH